MADMKAVFDPTKQDGGISAWYTVKDDDPVKVRARLVGLVVEYSYFPPELANLIEVSFVKSGGGAYLAWLYPGNPRVDKPYKNAAELLQHYL